ncbi:MAG TPA: M13 family metallopeptidase [Puia sp.]|nr:M13 family metallopeptidase [Puia sp.]
MKLFALLPVAFIALLFSCQSPTTDKSAGQWPDPIDSTAHDHTVRPQDNFFLYVNGAWIKNTVIPPSQSSWGSFSTLQDSSIARLHGILDSLLQVPNLTKGSIAQQTSDLYRSGMDSVGIEQKGIKPVSAELDRIRGIKNTDDLILEIATELQGNHNPFVNFYVSADDKNSLMNIVHLDQGGLGLPDRDYYFKTDTSTVKIKNGYKTYITRIFTLSGQPEDIAAARAGALLELETRLAKVSKKKEALRDPLENYNKFSTASLNKQLPGFGKFLNELGVNADTVLMGQPLFYQGLFTLLRNTELQTLKDYLTFHLIDDDADYLSHDFVDARFAFQRLLTGQSVMKERWKRMTTLVDQQLGEALGQFYVQKYFPPEAKSRINELVENIISTFSERLKNNDWMSDSTRTKAISKLRAIVKKVGYPDKWKDYSSVNIVPDDIISNIKATANFNYKRAINKIGKPVDRSEWFMTPPTINAYYDPTANNINFPAGILQPPFYFVHGDDAVNYGAIGMVIGHEITHGFDDQGRHYDADGNLKDWWTPADAERFTRRAQKIIQQYDSYIAIDTLHLNGKLTEGENIADNGGLAIAYAAFKKTSQGKSNEKINGLTPDQRFFIAAAQLWKIKLRPERLRLLTLTNEHSAPMWRVNGPASNAAAFYQAFNVTPRDSMYRPDSLRVKIW